MIKWSYRVLNSEIVISFLNILDGVSHVYRDTRFKYAIHFHLEQIPGDILKIKLLELNRLNHFLLAYLLVDHKCVFGVISGIIPLLKDDMSFGVFVEKVEDFLLVSRVLCYKAEEFVEDVEDALASIFDKGSSIKGKTFRDWLRVKRVVYSGRDFIHNNDLFRLNESELTRLWYNRTTEIKRMSSYEVITLKHHDSIRTFYYVELALNFMAYHKDKHNQAIHRSIVTIHPNDMTLKDLKTKLCDTGLDEVFLASNDCMATSIFRDTKSRKFARFQDGLAALH